MQIQGNSSQYDLRENRIKRKKLRARKRLELFKRLIIFLLLVITLTLIAFSPVFNIKSIEVVGNTHYDNDEITGVLDLVVGNNAFKSLFYDYSDIERVFRLSYGKSEDKILKNYAYIKAVKVYYSFLDKVVIRITEREPYAVVTGENINALIDSEGYVLEQVMDDFDNNEYIVINGLEFESAEPGQALNTNISETMKLLINFREAIDTTDTENDFKLMSVIESINIQDIRNIKLNLDSRITVNIGDVRNIDDLIYRLNYLREIFFKHVGNQTKGIVDFTIGEKPRFIPKLD